MKRDRSLELHLHRLADLEVKGWRVAVIGGTGGIGQALSRLLAARGAQVTVVGQTFRDADIPGIEFIKADLSLMREAQRVATLLPAETLDLLIFTTGIFAAPQRQETPEGIERDLAVSYLNRFVMLREWGPRLGLARPPGRAKPRVVMVAYPGSGQIGTPDDLNAEQSYKAFAAHMNTVVGNEALLLDGAVRYPQTVFVGLNPGLIKTGIRDNFFGKGSLKSRLTEGLIGWLTPTAGAYAERIAPVMLAPEIENRQAAMFNNKGHAILPSPSLTPDHVRKFMKASEALLARVGLARAITP